MGVTVAKIDAVQAEYSAFETIHETDGLIDTARELGIAYVAYSPLGHGWLVDNFEYNSPDDFAEGDFRRSCTSRSSLSPAHTPLTPHQPPNPKAKTSTRTKPSNCTGLGGGTGIHCDPRDDEGEQVIGELGQSGCGVE